MQVEANIDRLMTVHLKRWTSSNMWEQPKRKKKNLFRKKLRVGGSQWVIVIRCRFKIKIYWSIILPVVLYGCEIWSLTMREERGLRIFENSVQIIISLCRPDGLLIKYPQFQDLLNALNVQPHNIFLRTVWHCRLRSWAPDYRNCMQIV